jgi:hypothetical protein
LSKNKKEKELSGMMRQICQNLDAVESEKWVYGVY